MFYEIQEINGPKAVTDEICRKMIADRNESSGVRVMFYRFPFTYVSADAAEIFWEAAELSTASPHKTVSGCAYDYGGLV